MFLSLILNRKYLTFLMYLPLILSYNMKNLASTLTDTINASSKHYISYSCPSFWLSSFSNLTLLKGYVYSSLLYGAFNSKFILSSFCAYVNLVLRNLKKLVFMLKPDFSQSIPFLISKFLMIPCDNIRQSWCWTQFLPL